MGTLAPQQILTLRKGIVEEQVSSSFYLVKDIFTDDLISVTISAREHIGGLTFSVGETIYIIVSLYDLKRGRFYSNHQARGINIDFEAIKRQLDNGIDPLNLDKD